VALPTFASHTLLLQQSIDISCQRGAQQQTCSSRFAAMGQIETCGDRQTDGHRTVSLTLLRAVSSTSNMPNKATIIATKNQNISTVNNADLACQFGLAVAVPDGLFVAGFSPTIDLGSARGSGVRAVVTGRGRGVQAP